MCNLQGQHEDHGAGLRRANDSFWQDESPDRLAAPAESECRLSVDGPFPARDQPERDVLDQVFTRASAAPADRVIH